MTNMLPRDRAELIMTEHAAGRSIREIAAAYGHSTQTVRDYVLGGAPPANRRPGTMTSRRSPPTAGDGWPTTRT